MSELGRLLKKGRLKRGLSHQKVANILGLQSDSQIVRFEQGTQRISFRHIAKISMALNIDYDELCNAWLRDLEVKLYLQEKFICTTE